MFLPLTPRSRAAAAVLALSLTACGSNGEDVGRDAAAPASSSMPSMDMGAGSPSAEASAPVDAQFLTAMVPHHQSASDMAEIAVARAKDPEVKALAQRIIAAQGAEIAQMTNISQDEYGTKPSTEMMSMSHEMMGMTMVMDMDADLAELQSSATPDVTFLEMMIPHHASALTMADEEIKRGMNAEVKALATKIKADQAKEIGEMQQMLTRLA